MNSVTLPRDAYGIGIICALVEEKAAMEAMLDEEHEQLQQKSGDHNSYTFGKIGKHNVVIACLPGGHQGKAAAATLAVHMMYSFPIKLGLMVGIGGGVPSQVPTIRLGDVVVSMPEGMHGGVVQYDLGKLESDGFRRKGHLDKPSKALLGAVTSLRAKHERKDPDFPRYLTAIANNRRMATKYGFQGTQHDRLFGSEEIHPKDRQTCDHCVSSLRMVQRTDRDDDTHQVFYGTILSGDLVMKNGEERDRRAAADKAVCFEMEAAGLMNDFPCLVVRGISDYSDSHKNDRWQPYAAATAAAYAKELLGALSVQEVEKLGPANKHIVAFSLKGVPAIDHFVQRVNDMQKLEEHFFPQQLHLARRKMFVVHGLGDIGKTQLCIEFVRRHHEKYSGVFWLDGSSEDAIHRSFIDVVARLPAGEIPLALIRAAEQASPDQLSIVRGVMDWLSLPSNRQWLLVIDNVDRDHTTKEKDPLAYDVKQYFPTADHAQDDSSVDALLEKLGGLPLALTQAGAYISQTAVSINQYLEYYDSTWKVLMELQDEYPLQEYAQRSVLTTWRISYVQVKSQSEEASKLLQLWSFLYAGDLWYELVACTKELGAETFVPGWLTALTFDKLRFDRALALLMKYSLVEGRIETASYAMHSVLHSWCRYLGGSETERSSFRKLAVDIVGQMVPAESMREYWILQRRLLPHGQEILKGIEQETHTEIDVNELWAYEKLARMFADQDQHAGAEEMYGRALVGYEKAFGLEHTSTLGTVNNLGILYADQGRLAEAEEMYKRALAGKEKAPAPEHTSTLDTLNNLGSLYAHQGRFAEAEAMYKRALAGTGKALGPEHTSTLGTVNNLGSLYADQGRLVEAEAMYKRALAGKEKALGPEHTSTLNTLNNLGNLYADQGRLAEAEAMYKRALAGYEKALGPEHTSTLSTVNNLGNLYRRQGRLAEAEAMYVRALAGYEKALGPEHKYTIETAQDLRALRMLPREPAAIDKVPDYWTVLSERPNSRLAQDATLLSPLPTTPNLISGVEEKEKKHRSRKPDAFFRKLRLR
ncbi:purine and uridine phosphorylase, partial [Aureobasidium melanogenum]